MELIAEIIVEILFAFGIFGIQWCIRHKQVTYAILAAILVLIDVFVWLRLLGKI